MRLLKPKLFFPLHHLHLLLSVITLRKFLVSLSIDERSSCFGCLIFELMSFEVLLG